MANLSGYNFAYLDEQTKRMIRRAILKAVAIPGYQVPFGGREMPMPYGWGTGGIQLTASVIGESDVLKVIDQGADDTTNAVSIRNFFKRVTGVNTTERTDDATLIQTRHRIPETPLTEDQIIIFQVPIPEPLRFIEPRETETRTMHALEEYGVMQVKLYEDIARFGHIATTYAYPVKVNGEPLDFTYLEYALLAFLVTHPGRTYSRDALLRRVWGFDYYGGSRTVDVHVRRVRAKLGPELAQRLETVRGVGYLWSA